MQSIAKEVCCDIDFVDPAALFPGNDVNDSDPEQDEELIVLALDVLQLSFRVSFVEQTLYRPFVANNKLLHLHRDLPPE
jgi:hypothetical protein